MKGSSSLARTARDWAALAWRAKFQAADLAPLAGMGARTLRRYFRKRFRTTPQRWLDRLRLREAVRLLRAGKRTKDVAYTFHYKQPSHFCRQFKERYGLPPQAWVSRRRHSIAALRDPTAR